MRPDVPRFYWPFDVTGGSDNITQTYVGEENLRALGSSYLRAWRGASRPVRTGGPGDRRKRQASSSSS
jgi:hypothetical protein